MKQYNKTPENMGGLLKIWSIPIADITESTENNLVLKTQANIVALPIQDESATLNIISEVTDAGLIHTVDVSATLISSTTDKNTLSANLATVKHAFLVQTANNEFLLCGSNLESLKTKINSKTGRISADLNSYSLISGAKLVDAPFAVPNPFAT